jgi:hypothetical protein
MKINKWYLVIGSIGLFLGSNLAHANLGIVMTSKKTFASSGQPGDILDVRSMEVTATSIVIKYPDSAAYGSTASTGQILSKTYSGGAVVFAVNRMVNVSPSGPAYSSYAKRFEMTNNGGQMNQSIDIGGDISSDLAAGDSMASQIEHCLLGINGGVYSKLTINADPAMFKNIAIACSK